MTDQDRDGIGTCEDLIRNAGGAVARGIIKLPGQPAPDVLEAAQFLIEEWDYCIG